MKEVKKQDPVRYCCEAAREINIKELAYIVPTNNEEK